MEESWTQPMDREPGDRPAFTWCLHCERAYPTEDWITRHEPHPEIVELGLVDALDTREDWYCPHPDCDGSGIDAHPWESNAWPRNAHLEYPETPNPGGYYPLGDPEPGLAVGEPVDWKAWRQNRED